MLYRVTGRITAAIQENDQKERKYIFHNRLNAVSKVTRMIPPLWLIIVNYS
jgi:hypothetical protein